MTAPDIAAHIAGYGPEPRPPVQEIPNLVTLLHEAVIAREQALAPRTHCIDCKEPFGAANVFTEAGAREAQISGICERCFDELFAEADETEEDEL